MTIGRRDSAAVTTGSLEEWGSRENMAMEICKNIGKHRVRGSGNEVEANVSIEGRPLKDSDSGVRIT